MMLGQITPSQGLLWEKSPVPMSAEAGSTGQCIPFVKISLGVLVDPLPHHGTKELIYIQEISIYMHQTVAAWSNKPILLHTDRCHATHAIT
jgi:hypothetical protein